MIIKKIENKRLLANRIFLRTTIYNKEDFFHFLYGKRKNEGFQTADNKIIKDFVIKMRFFDLSPTQIRTVFSLNFCQQKEFTWEDRRPRRQSKRGIQWLSTIPKN